MTNLNNLTKEDVQRLIDDLRAIAPNRPLTYGESIQVARRQAAYLRRWTDPEKHDINLLWLLDQKAIPVRRVPSHELREESGLTTDLINPWLEMLINQDEPLVRQRFSLLHEFKHALDFYDAPTLHRKLGTGSAKLQKDMIEAIANEFAGHVLMPTPNVKRLWFSTKDLGLMANLFNVSREAMSTRLERMGLIGEPKPHPRVYFRTVGQTVPAETSNVLAVA